MSTYIYLASLVAPLGIIALLLWFIWKQLEGIAKSLFTLTLIARSRGPSDGMYRGR